MRIKAYIVLLACMALLSLSWGQDFQVLSSKILDEIWSFHPVTATHLGIHKYDKQMPDYTKKSRNQRLEGFKQLGEQLDNVDTTALSQDDLVDYYLLKALLDDEIFDLEAGSIYEQNPLLYVRSCIDGIYTIMIRHAASPEKRMQVVTARLKEIPAFLETAQKISHDQRHCCVRLAPTR